MLNKTTRKILGIGLLAFMLTGVYAEADQTGLADQYYRKGVISFKKNDFDSAEQYLLRILSFNDIDKILTLKAKYWLAEIYYNNNQTKRAKQFYFEIVNEDPTFMYIDYVRYSLGRIYLLQKDNKKAMEYFKLAATTTKPDLAEAVTFYVGVGQYDAGLIKESEATLTQYVTKFPNGKYKNAVYLVMAELMIQKGDFENAMNYYRQCQASPTYKDKSHLGLGWCYYALGMPEMALQEYDEYLKTAPEDESKRKVLFQKAVIYYQLGKHKEAFALFDDILTKTKDPSIIQTALIIRILSSYNLKKWADIMTSSTQYRNTYPDGEYIDVVNLMLGVAYYMTGNSRESELAFTNIAEKSIALRGRFFLAELKYKKKDYKGASEIYKQISESALPAFYKINALNGLGWCAFESSDYVAGVKFFDQFLETYPKNNQAETALFMKSYSLVCFNDYDTAYNGFADFIQKYPNSPYIDMVKFLLGFSLFQKASYSEAIKYFLNLTGNATLDKQLLGKSTYWLAESYYGLKDWEKAAEIFAAMLKTPTDVVPQSKLYVELGYCYYYMGKYDQAIYYYREGLQKFPSDPLAKHLQYGIVMSLYRQGKYDETNKEVGIFVEKYNDKQMVESVIKNLKALME